MSEEPFVDPNLTPADREVIENLLCEIRAGKNSRSTSSESHNANNDRLSTDSGYESQDAQDPDSPDVNPLSQQQATQKISKGKMERTVSRLKALNNPEDAAFEPTVFVSKDLRDIKLPTWIDHFILQPYICLAQKVVRRPTDIVMFTHILLYFTTSVPSAALLFSRFSWIHGICHSLMQGWYIGTYTLMMHQHIHMRGVLSKSFAWFDHMFPYILDPLMGHTWNSYFYHHVKHHHIEGNGPDDLSSTIRYQRDELTDFLRYVGRFLFLIWFDLPRYFISKGKWNNAFKALFFEVIDYITIYAAWCYNPRAATFALIIPLILTRLGLMVGNWGQHAFVDEVEPDSDFRSSITLIDVASNRFCYNDGYHTSHHLNPLRHWREHPISFMLQKERYAAEHALVFQNIDYIMITVRLILKDYGHLARCLVPIGDQIGMSLEEIESMLKTKTRKFSEEDIRAKFETKKSA